MRILHLDILVTHEGPRRQVGTIELSCTSEVLDGLLMLSAQGVIISYDDSVSAQFRGAMLADSYDVPHQ